MCGVCVGKVRLGGGVGGGGGGGWGMAFECMHLIALYRTLSHFIALYHFIAFYRVLSRFITFYRVLSNRVFIFFILNLFMYRKITVFECFYKKNTHSQMNLTTLVHSFLLLGKTLPDHKMCTIS